MPTILRLGPYRLFFYSSDGAEPPHVHIERDHLIAKYWLSPPRLARSWRRGMTISTLEAVRATAAHLSEDALTVDLSNGRTVSAPLAWFPRLLHASATERLDWRLIGDGEGLHRAQLDEDISVDALLAGRRSAESASSLAAWLAQHAKRLRQS